MANIKSLFIPFYNASELPDALCPDGEFPDASGFFPDSPASSSSGADDDDDVEVDNGVVCVSGTPVCDIPEGARVLGSHRPSASASGNLLVLDPHGSLLRLMLSSPQSGWEASPVLSADCDLSRLKILASAGDWVVLGHDGIPPLFMLWIDEELRYSSASPIPGQLLPRFELADAALPGFNSVAGDLPTLTVELDCPEGLKTSVSDWLNGVAVAETDAFSAFRDALDKSVVDSWLGFIHEASLAGLHVAPFLASAALRRTYADGRKEIISPSAPALLGDDFSGINLRLHGFTFSDGRLRLSLRSSVRARELRVTLGDDSRPEWLRGCGCLAEAQPLLLLSQDIRVTDEIPVADGLRNLPSVDGDSSRRRGWIIRMLSRSERQFRSDLPASLYEADNLLWNRTVACTSRLSSSPLEIDMRLYDQFRAAGGTSLNGRMILYGEGLLRISPAGMPASADHVSVFEGEEILALLPSLRSLSSGEFGAFPLYAFCRDGIRALSPDSERGLRSVQLVCRDIPLEGVAPVSTTTGVAFASARGVLMLEGTRVSLLDGMEDVTPDRTLDGCRLAWHYPSDSIVVGFAEGDCIAYSIRDKKWRTLSFRSDDFIEAWPHLFNIERGSVSELLPRRVADATRAAAEAPDADSAAIGKITGSRVLISRPIKLGSDAVGKRIRRAIFAADGNVEGRWKIEGSDDLRRWRPVVVGRGLISPPAWASPYRYFRLRLTVGTPPPSGITLFYSVQR